MTRTSKLLSPLAVALVAVLICALAGSVAAENEGSPPWPRFAYVHAALGLGFAVLFSKDMQNYVDDQLGVDYKITNVGVDFAYSVRAGIRNLAQFEYRLERGVGHKLFYDGGTLNSSQINMSIDSDEWLVKFNPFFALYDDPSVATFLMYGRGNPTYLDDLGKGFSDGNKTILGVEITKLYRFYAFSVSFERHSLSFHRAVMGGTEETGRSFSGSFWILQGSVSAGVGL